MNDSFYNDRWYLKFIYQSCFWNRNISLQQICKLWFWRSWHHTGCRIYKNKWLVRSTSQSKCQRSCSMAKLSHCWAEKLCVSSVECRQEITGRGGKDRYGGLNVAPRDIWSPLPPVSISWVQRQPICLFLLVSSFHFMIIGWLWCVDVQTMCQASLNKKLQLPLYRKHRQVKYQHWNTKLYFIEWKEKQELH